MTLVPSREMRERILRNPSIRPERIYILYPGLPFAEIASKARQPLPGIIEKWLVALPGRLLVHAAMPRAEKGHLFVLDVLPRLLPDFPDLRYVIARDGWERGAIQERISALKIEEHVLLAGMVHPDAALLKQAEMVIMPSLIEPLGLAQIEALNLGIPVAASHVGGIPETITHQKTGLLAEPDNSEAWQDAMTWGLNHPEQMQTMAAAGRTDVLLSSRQYRRQTGLGRMNERGWALFGFLRVALRCARAVSPSSATDVWPCQYA
jgi:glycosyltransferase involved in cell wall biosynthesis